MAGCGHKVPCGCGDNALSSQPPCDALPGCGASPCGEMFSDECIVYDGTDAVVNVQGTDIAIKKGTTISEIWQRLAASITDPACGERVAISAKVTSIEANSISLQWLNGTASMYKVVYNSTTAVDSGESPNLSSTNNKYTLTGLLPGEEYDIHIEAVGYGCSSIKLKTKTLE